MQKSFSDEIKNAYGKLKTIIMQVPHSMRTRKIIKGTGGKVSIVDLIAYQIGWGKLLISWYEAGLQNEMPDMPGEGFLTWDYVGLAKIFYDKYHYDGNKKQLGEFERTVQKIIKIISTEEKSGNLDRIGVWDWCTLKSGKQWPLSKWIRINTIAPYKKAVALIKGAQIKSLYDVTS